MSKQISIAVTLHMYSLLTLSKFRGILYWFYHNSFIHLHHVQSDLHYYRKGWTLFPHCLSFSMVQNKTHFHNLLCFDLYDLSRRSSGLVSRPLCDLSLSPCITGRKACWPIRPGSKNVSGCTTLWRYNHENFSLRENSREDFI